MKSLMLLAAAVCATFAVTCYHASASSVPLGRPVSPELAETIRGGLCANRGTANCSDPNVTGCSACVKVTAGTTYGESSGECYCDTTCGSFFDTLKTCGG